MQTNAYAKINLYLDVTDKRSDGYHDILSVMQTVDLCDVVSVEYDTSAKGEIVLACGKDLPCDERNLAYRAVQAYFKHEVPFRIMVDVQKNIPQEAGLAGGSADCAAVLRLLNAEFGQYSERELIALGASLGADVPFCLVGGTQITRGIGQVLEACAPMPDCYMVIARGGEGVSTPRAYRDLDTLYGDFSARKSISEQRLRALSDAMRGSDLVAVCHETYNIFESVVLPTHSVASKLKQMMKNGGAVGAMMSGSGPSVVGFFADQQTARRVHDAIAQNGIAAFVVRPVNKI